MYSTIQNAKKVLILLKAILLINVPNVDLIHWNICRKQELREKNMGTNLFKYDMNIHMNICALFPSYCFHEENGANYENHTKFKAHSNKSIREKF